jgi:acetyl-CoA synthase
MWMPKQLKEDMRELMEKRAKELGIPNFLDKIADETNVTDPAQLMEWCIEVGHPAMALPNLMEFM